MPKSQTAQRWVCPPQLQSDGCMYLCFITDPSGLVYTLGCLSTGQPALPRFRLSATRTKRKPSSLCDTCRLPAILRREADSVYRRRDRKSVVSGTSVSVRLNLGGVGIIKK